MEQTLTMQSWLSATQPAQAQAITGSFRTRGATSGATKVTSTSECHQALVSAVSTNKLSTPTFRRQREKEHVIDLVYKY